MNFKVGLTRDLSNSACGFSWGNVSIETLSPLSWEFMTNTEPFLAPKDFLGYHGVAFAGVGINGDSFDSPEESPIVISRFGVGYDNVDLAACTRAGVALTITPDGSKNAFQIRIIQEITLFRNSQGYTTNY